MYLFAKIHPENLQINYQPRRTESRFQLGGPASLARRANITNNVFVNL